MGALLTPAEVAALRRQAAAEVLAAAAAHSLLSDQLQELEARQREHTWTGEEASQYGQLRARLDEARRRHDEAHRRLRAISAFGSRAARAQIGQPRAG